MKKRTKKKFEKAVKVFDRDNFGSMQYLMSSYYASRSFAKRFYPESWEE